MAEILNQRDLGNGMAALELSDGSEAIRMANGDIALVDSVADFEAYGEDMGPIMAGLVNMRQYILDRLPEGAKTGALRELPGGAIEGVQQARPVSSAIGQAFFPIAAGMAVPGAGVGGIAAQGAVQGGLEALRQDSTLGDIGTATAFGAGGQALGNMATRVATGIARGVQASRGGKALTTTSKGARLAAETGLGRGLVDDINQKLLLKKVGNVLGIQNLKKLTRKSLGDGAKNIGKIYDDALRTTSPVDVTESFVQLSDLPPTAVPGRNKLIELFNKVDADPGNPTALRALHRALRDTRAKMNSNPLTQSWVDDMDDVLGLLDDAAATAGADTGMLQVANQRWKVLKTLEETPDAWVRGRLNPGTLANKLGRDSFKGFGSAIKRGNTAAKLEPTTAAFVDDVLNLAEDIAPVGSSGTAERLITGGGALAGGSALLSGAIDPVTAGLGLAAYGIVPPIAAAASVGRPIAAIGGAIAGATAPQGSDEK